VAGRRARRGRRRALRPCRVTRTRDPLRGTKAKGHGDRRSACRRSGSRTPLNLDNVAKQRQLNDKGRADAKAVGNAFKAAGVPIGKSNSSRFYRAVETARLIGGKDWFEIREGEASIFKPDGKGSYTLIARVPIDQWATVKK